MRHRGARFPKMRGAWPQLRIPASIHCPIHGSKSTRHGGVTFGLPNTQKAEIDKAADGTPPVSSVECLFVMRRILMRRDTPEGPQTTHSGLPRRLRECLLRGRGPNPSER